MRFNIQNKAGMYDYILFIFIYRTIIPFIPSQLCLYTGNQFQRKKGLCDIIVCPQCETCDFVGFLSLRRQHDNRILIFFPYFPAKLKPIHIRQHNVQNCQIQGL